MDGFGTDERGMRPPWQELSRGDIPSERSGGSGYGGLECSRIPQAFRSSIQRNLLRMDLDNLVQCEEDRVHAKTATPQAS